MNQLTPQELSTLQKAFHKFGHDLIGRGIGFIKTAFKLQPKEYNRYVILNFLSDQTGLSTSTISLADSIYFTESWDKWQQIIGFDLIDTKKYLKERFDCDNFALAFASRGGLIYGLNTCGVAFGDILNKKTKQKIGRHAFNLIITQDNGILHLYLYEPMNDQYKLWEKGKDNALSGTTPWIYKPDWCLFY